MKPKEYIEKAKRIEVPKYRFQKTGDITPRLEHAILGIASESSEITEALKRSKIYGAKLDKVRLIENLGDLFWYIALLCDELKVSFEEVWSKNIKKLKLRYPEKYTDERAIKQAK